MEPVHDMFIDGHAELVDSMDAQGESSCVMVEMVDSDADDALVVQSFLEIMIQRLMLIYQSITMPLLGHM